MTAIKHLFSSKQFILQQTQIKKRESRLHIFWSSKQDSSTFDYYKLHTRHHDHFIRLQRAI